MFEDSFRKFPCEWSKIKLKSTSPTCSKGWNGMRKLLANFWLLILCTIDNSICLSWEMARHDMIWTVSDGAKVLSCLVVDSSEDSSSEHNTGLRRAAEHTTTGFSRISCHKADVSRRREKKVTNHCAVLESSEVRDCWMKRRKWNQKNCSGLKIKTLIVFFNRTV